VSFKSPKNNLPPPLNNLTLKELFIFTGIPLHLLEGFIKRKFKPSREDREKLTDISRRFYSWSESEKKAFIQRKKYRTVKLFLSLNEKEQLFLYPKKYDQTLDALIDKYWDRVVLAVTRKQA